MAEVKSPSPRDPTRRFSDRVGFYIRSRPTYPQSLIELCRAQMGLGPEHVIADVGCGTGISSELFLHNGNRVIGIEPNDEMRQAAEVLLKKYPLFTALNGSAEKTGLEDSSVDFIIAGQAFHWFDASKSRAEFLRILKPDGWIILVWNDRRQTGTPFLDAYTQLLEEFNTDLHAVVHTNVTRDTAAFDKFFGSAKRELVIFDNHQDLTFERFKDRVLSSSYMPGESDPKYPAMLERMKNIFESNEKDGFVRLEYETRAYYGRLS